MQAIQIMSALAQASRLRVYEILVDSLPEGLTAGEISKAVGMSPNGMTPHYAVLTAAGLISAEKRGRHVIYRAQTKPVEQLSAFLADAVERGRATER
ncbi:ArsR/SmtB family transcription factor [Sphingomonas sp. NPDC079357]|uniref:ArsR/SmtB family transcription factor n=1 Tax=Sphingomonas sp. NPDC079357 TaxID=3364518 RepID=UPI00384BE88A